MNDWLLEAAKDGGMILAHLNNLVKELEDIRDWVPDNNWLVRNPYIELEYKLKIHNQNLKLFEVMLDRIKCCLKIEVIK